MAPKVERADVRNNNEIQKTEVEVRRDRTTGSGRVRRNSEEISKEVKESGEGFTVDPEALREIVKTAKARNENVTNPYFSVETHIRERRDAIERNRSSRRETTRLKEVKDPSKEWDRETESFVQLFVGTFIHAAKLIYMAARSFSRFVDSLLYRLIDRSKEDPVTEPKPSELDFRVTSNDYQKYQKERDELKRYWGKGFTTASFEGTFKEAPRSYLHEFVTEGQLRGWWEAGPVMDSFEYKIVTEAVKDPGSFSPQYPKDSGEVKGYQITAGWVVDNQVYHFFIRSTDRKKVEEIHRALADKIWSFNDTQQGVELALKWLLEESRWGNRGEGIIENLGMPLL